jgi:glycosyltransferase involved in cell wall biosynthesis
MGSVAAIVEQTCVRLPDRIVAVTAGTADKLVAMGAKRDHVYVVSNPVDLDQLRAAVPHPSAPELLFVGRLIDHKQANLAIEATRILAARGRDIHLGLVGVGPEDSRLRDQVAYAGLNAQVTFYGAIDTQSDLWSLIRGAKVLLAPSVREGFGLVVAESLAMGTPVVCAIHPENESSHLVGPTTGSLIPPFDAEALADAAEYWLNNDSQRPDRVSAFLKEHAELTGDAMSTSYANILRSVTSIQN